MKACMVGFPHLNRAWEGKWHIISPNLPILWQTQTLDSLSQWIRGWAICNIPGPRLAPRTKFMDNLKIRWWIILWCKDLDSRRRLSPKRTGSNGTKINLTRCKLVMRHRQIWICQWLHYHSSYPKNQVTWSTKAKVLHKWISSMN